MDEFERDQLKTVLMHAIGEMGSEIERAIGEGLMAGLRAVFDTAFVDIPERVRAVPEPGYPGSGGVSISGHYTTSILAPCGCSMPLQFKVHAAHGEQPTLDEDVRGVLLGSHKRVGIALEFGEVGSPIPCSEHRPPTAPPSEIVSRLVALLQESNEIGPWSHEHCDEDPEGGHHLDGGSLKRSALVAIHNSLPYIPAQYAEDLPPIDDEADVPLRIPTHGTWINQTALEVARDIARVADHFDDRHEGASTILGPISDVVEVNLADLRTLRTALPKEAAPHEPTAPTQEQVAFSCCGGVDAHDVGCRRRS